MAAHPKDIATEEELPLIGENTLLLNAANGRIKFDGIQSVNKQWAMARDAVTYPVEIVNAYYKRPVSKNSDKTMFVNANGTTNTGRDKHFNLVVVDKYRQGIEAMECIGVVTGLYSTIDTERVYADLEDQLKELGIKHHIRELYVSGTGGTQRLLLEMDEMRALGEIPDDLVMQLRINTSVDGTAIHSVSLHMHNQTGNNSIALYGSDYRLNARHTTTIHERSVDFTPQINKIIANWNETIVPLMKLMYEDRFNKRAALSMVDAMAKESGLGERHREKVVKLYESDEVRSNVTEDCLYRVALTLNQYVEEELANRPELQERLKKGLAKSLKKHAPKVAK